MIKCAACCFECFFILRADVESLNPPLNKVSKAFAPVAQWIEHPPPKGRVTRSIRVGGTIIQY